jgi:hypothetical protein
METQSGNKKNCKNCRRLRKKIENLEYEIKQLGYELQEETN